MKKNTESAKQFDASTAEQSTLSLTDPAKNAEKNSAKSHRRKILGLIHELKYAIARCKIHKQFHQADEYRHKRRILRLKLNELFPK